MKLILTVILILLWILSHGQHHNNLIQASEIYKKNGVKKVMYKFAYRNERIYNYLFDINGNEIESFVQSKENGPIESQTKYEIDLNGKLIKTISIQFKDFDRPLALRNSSADTTTSIIDYDISGRQIKETTFRKDKIVSVRSFLSDQHTEITTFYLNGNDTIVTESRFDQFNHVIFLQTNYYLKKNSVKYVMQQIEYKYSGESLKKEMINTKYYRSDTNKTDKLFRVNFYSYFKNGLIKMITSKELYGVTYKYEYF